MKYLFSEYKQSITLAVFVLCTDILVHYIFKETIKNEIDREIIAKNKELWSKKFEVIE